ncbi:winged helix DNA-binding protein [Desulfosporosinus fructosivorans]
MVIGEMTRGAISKITKKLTSKDAISSYQKEDNRKEVYFRLTDYGELLYKKHKITMKFGNEEMKLFLSC